MTLIRCRIGRQLQMSRSLLLLTLVLLLPLGACGSDSASKWSYVGNWTRIELKVDGAAQSFDPATLTLTIDTFAVTSPSSLCKEQSGEVKVEGSRMTWTVKVLNGPHACGAVGSTTVYEFLVDDGRLTLTSSGAGSTVEEVYRAQ